MPPWHFHRKVKGPKIELLISSEQINIFWFHKKRWNNTEKTFSIGSFFDPSIALKIKKLGNWKIAHLPWAGVFVKFIKNNAPVTHRMYTMPFTRTVRSFTSLSSLVQVLLSQRHEIYQHNQSSNRGMINLKHNNIIFRGLAEVGHRRI